MHFQLNYIFPFIRTKQCNYERGKEESHHKQQVINSTRSKTVINNERNNTCKALFQIAFH